MPPMPLPPRPARLALNRLARLDPDLARIEREAAGCPGARANPVFRPAQRHRRPADQQPGRRRHLAPPVGAARRRATRRPAAAQRGRSPRRRPVTPQDRPRPAPWPTPSRPAFWPPTRSPPSTTRPPSPPFRRPRPRPLGRPKSTCCSHCSPRRVPRRRPGAASLPRGPQAPAPPGPRRASCEPWPKPGRHNRALAARLLWHWWRHRTGRPSMDDPRPA